VRSGIAALRCVTAVSAVSAGVVGLASGCDDSLLVELLPAKAVCESTESCGTPCADDFTCGPGLYCSAQGYCTADCAPVGALCGAGRTCTSRGRCVPSETLTGTGGNGHTGGLVALAPGSVGDIRANACVEWRSNPDPLPTLLMTVVDVSGSMDEAVSEATTKWEVTRIALTEAIATMPGSTLVGMLLYPNRETSASDEPRPVAACVNVGGLVPVAPLQDPSMTQLDRLLSTLWGADVVGGGTPTHDAYTYALSALRVSVPEGAAHLLLITDGQPTYSLGCVGTGRAEDPVDEQPIVRAIAAARENGTRTFVIGSPGSEGTGADGLDARPWLSRAASAGGTAREACSHDGPVYCHFDMVDEPDFAMGLSSALGRITGTIMPCEYVIPAPPTGKTLDPEAVHVVWTLEDGSQHELLRDDRNECGEGWRFTGDGGRVALCPASCQRIRSASGDQLELFFGCSQIVVR